MDRPVVYVAAAFTVGVCVATWGVWIPHGLFYSVLAAAILFFLGGFLAISRINPGRTRPASIVCWAFTAGVLLTLPRLPVSPGDSLSDLLGNLGNDVPDQRIISARKALCQVEGVVRLADLETGVGSSCVFLLDADTVIRGEQRIPCEGGMSVRWENPSVAIFAHERVRVSGEYTLSLARINPGTGSYEDYLRSRGIHTALFATGNDAVQRLETPFISIAYWASRLRNVQSDCLARVVPEKALPFVQAIWLGYRTSIAGDAYDAFVASGTAHILSVSGLHMAMIYATALFLLKMVVRHPRLRTLLCMAAILAFTLMSGLRASAVRSAFMLLVYLCADLLDREPDAPTALGESGLCLLIWDPLVLFDGGFQLSFLSVASMLLFGPPISRKLEWLPLWVRGAIATPLAVQLLPFPLAIHYFHVFPLLSLPANLLLVPLSTVALWLCFITTLTAWLWLPLGLLFGQALGWTVTLIQWIADTISRPSFTHVVLPSPTLAGIVAYYGLLLCVCVLLFCLTDQPNLRRRWRWTAAGLAVLLIVVWRAPFSEPTVVFLDVGHGDATFIRGGEGKTLLVDAGDANPRRDAGRRIVAPFLWSNNVTRLDYLLLSHMDRDHIGGAFYLLDHFPVGAVLVGPMVLANPTGNVEDQEAAALSGRLIAQCRARAIPIHIMQAGDYLALPEMGIEVLHPPETYPAGGVENNGSLVLRLTWNGIRILLTGDVEKEAEAVLAQGDCQCEIIKAPHHGSKTSSSGLFLDAVNPKHVVISSAGTQRRQGLDNSVLRRYEEKQVRVWRTDQLGGIQLFAEKDGLRFEATRIMRRYPVSPP